MGFAFTRRQLYELVWQRPVSVVAESLGVSNVGLAKACRRGDIPLPPRGYWARLHAGQHVTRSQLPPRGPGASDRVDIGSGKPQAFRIDDNDDGSIAEYEIPQPPVYDETLEAIEKRIRQSLPQKFRYVHELENSQPLIAQLLREDDVRRNAMAKSGYSWDKPRFESRFEQRRLIFLSNLFRLLVALDVRCTIRGREARQIILQVGSQHVDLRVDLLESLRPRKRIPGGKSGALMALEVRVARWKHDDPEERLFWSDGPTGKLEIQLRDIAVALVLTGERQYRKAKQFSYEWNKHFAEDRIKRIGEAARAAEASAREELAQSERDRIGRLLSQVTAHQQAQLVRNYVCKVRDSKHALDERAFDGDFEAWSRWALSVADQIDPLCQSFDTERKANNE
ncbi:hypothetical protein PPMP20_08995 [Paraburkholderia phymatum]|uniref:Uncharacterized protein n=1 Tax=Paraburkholderia phymatum (strain DSM 17167 / CIP 108236 / LMG 21445 / STM815) TaxID=391038 RepID=B2JC64_PARP8|nr:hypothetical protein [Paraburkholderia phymatum]ACC69428.1 conserved hypothetical protein [Paraburkholderia phymatum STM815]